MNEIIVAAFYKFARFPHFAAAREPLQRTAEDAEVYGTILLADEGINGTIAGARAGIDAVLRAIKNLPGFSALEWKESYTDENPFHRMKVRLKKEIVTLGVTDIDPEASWERYVEPQDWNKVVLDPDTVVIDTRNSYEVDIGSFKGAINPETKSFREFPAWFRQFREENNIKRVAMFCTGGIRCEKSTAFLRSEGVEDVVHLKGGILKYLETVPEANSLWEGECFVFDNRVSVTHDLAPGAYDMCHACRMPLSAVEKASPHYAPGVSCPNCIDSSSDDQKRRFAERQKQQQLAKARGERHIGPRKRVQNG
ncbi:MAG: rhodanese-related sulfurtransferase [Pseudomonadota bacterium]